MSVPRNWRLQQQRYRLVGEICETCNSHIFPPRDVCPECEAPAKTPFNFSGRGEVYSYSTVYHPPQGFEEFAPYMVALVTTEQLNMPVGGGGVVYINNDNIDFRRNGNGDLRMFKMWHGC